jgi:hypothetical protein
MYARSALDFPYGDENNTVLIAMQFLGSSLPYVLHHAHRHGDKDITTVTIQALCT